jgi:DNA polymerase III epsilon subunit-like protein
MDSYVQRVCEKWKTDIREKVTVGWEPLQLNGEADIMFGETIVDIKCIGELYIRHYILLLLMNFCYSVTANAASGQRVNPRYKSTSIIVNPYQGAEYTVDVSVTPADMFKILNMLADDCHLKFSGLNIVYDLETTGLIKRVAGRMIVPEIVQISMKDYNTGLLVYNHHVKPKQKLSEEVKKIIGIDDSKLVDKPSIDTTRKWMGIQLRNVRDMKMYAHNGNSFDAPILEYYRIIPTSVNASWYDTISVINMAYKEKLVSRKLGDLHQLFLKAPIKNQHTSMADVDALIAIMRHLQVDL